MQEKQDRRTEKGLNRRDFLGTLGAAAAVGAVLRGEGAEASEPAMYRDSFGRLMPANPDVLAFGLSPAPGDNILMIMVDQLRAPRWLPATGQAALDALSPNIAALRNASFVFPNYFVAATCCTPSRATLLTGLYSQQTYMFSTQINGREPSLVPFTGPTTYPFTGSSGFPTIGNVLSQATPGYDTVWIGKWHLSDYNSETSGPYPAYGFTDQYSIPGSNPNGVYPVPAGYPSPEGAANQSTMGNTLTGALPSVASSDSTLPISTLTFLQLNDGAIADAFVNYWLPSARQSPWFCAVSFIGPHDMSDFPYYYGLAGIDEPTTAGVFGPPAGVEVGESNSVAVGGFLPPPLCGNGSVANANGATIAPLPGAACNPAAPPAPYPANGPTPTGPNGGSTVPWNNNDDPAFQPYGTYSATLGYGKPTLQTFFQNSMNQGLGQMGDGTSPQDQGSVNAWFTFLNYYFWMQSNVDAQIGRVTAALKSSRFANNTTVIFLSDHGDYCGSHNLHAKGGALYDESVNVPFYVSLPGQTTSFTIPYSCSSVDILPLLYTLALGSESWRTNSEDMIYYLRGRESIFDFMFSSKPMQRRTAPGIPNASGSGNQPYILHTTDEYPAATNPVSGNYIPSHAIAFRTVDYTVNANSAPPYGGGKLGVYSFWNLCSPSTQPDNQPQQFEFYNYSPNPPGGQSPAPTANPAETGNQAFTSSGALAAEAALYNTSFLSSIVQAELYGAPGFFPSYILSAQTTALQNYLNYVEPNMGGKCAT